MLEFNWQKEGWDGSFLGWVFVKLVPHTDKKRFEELSKATSGFTDVKLTMQVNGIEVDTQEFIETLPKVLQAYAEKHAKTVLSELAAFEELREYIQVFEFAACTRLRELAEKLNLNADFDE